MSRGLGRSGLSKPGPVLKIENSKGPKPLNLAEVIAETLETERQVFFLRDTSNRPLGESKIPATARGDVLTERVSCPYHDVRKSHAHPMNRSALIDIVQSWPAILDKVHSLRRAVVGDVSQLNSVSFFDLLKISESLVAWVTYDFLRLGREFRPTEIQAGVFKTMLGPRGLVRDLMELIPLNKNFSLESRFTKEVLLDYVNTSGALIGPIEVCAGPPHMIEALVQSLCESPARFNQPPEPADFVHGLRTIADWNRICFMTRKIVCSGIVQTLAASEESTSALESIRAAANLKVASGFDDPQLPLKRAFGLLHKKSERLWMVEDDLVLSREAGLIRKDLQKWIKDGYSMTAFASFCERQSLRVISKKKVAGLLVEPVDLSNTLTGVPMLTLLKFAGAKC